MKTNADGGKVIVATVWGYGASCDRSGYWHHEPSGFKARLGYRLSVRSTGKRPDAQLLLDTAQRGIAPAEMAPWPRTPRVRPV